MRARSLKRSGKNELPASENNDETARKATSTSAVDEIEGTSHGQSTDETGSDARGADESTVSTSDATEDASNGRSGRLTRVLVFAVMPVVVMVLGAGAGALKWMNLVSEQHIRAETESVQAAQNAAAALLSYSPGTVEQQLHAARDLLTGSFLDAYTSLTNEVVIPGAKQKNISTVASVPAAASVDANANHAVVLLFIDQQVTMTDSPPTGSQSTVKVTLDKVGDRWLVSGFDPI